MKESPILMNAFSMQAYLTGWKTQTRRVIKPSWARCLDLEDENDQAKALQQCPYGQPGDHLWFRETWRVGGWNADDQSITVDYRADNYARPELLYVEDEEQFERLWEQSSEDAAKAGLVPDDEGYHWKPGQAPTRWRPNIYMPRWASRCCCPEILRVRVERVQDIDEVDAQCEGWDMSNHDPGETYDPVTMDIARQWFAGLWDAINAKRGFSWEVNPWVWAITFSSVPDGS